MKLGMIEIKFKYFISEIAQHRNFYEYKIITTDVIWTYGLSEI